MSLTPAYIVLAVSSVGLCVVALLAARERRKPSPLLRDRRTLHEQLYDAVGVTCWHLPEHDREDCDCRSQGDL